MNTAASLPRLLVAACLFTAAVLPGADTPEPLTLRFDSPAADSGRGFQERSLPLGNGYMGINVFGGTETELISVTENSVANPYGKGGVVRPGDPPSARQGLNLPAKTYIDFGHREATGYTRTLSLDTATARVRYTCGGVTYTRDYFASYPDRVTVMRFTASRPGALSFTLRPTVPFVRSWLGHPGDGKSKTGRVTLDPSAPNRLNLSGTLGWYRVNFGVRYRVLHRGGTLTAQTDPTGTHSTLTVTGADSAVILMAAGTNYRLSPRVFTAPDSEKLDASETPDARLDAILDAAEKQSYDTLYANHQRDYRGLFARVSVSWGGKARPGETTPQLLARNRTAADAYLEELHFQFGRYLLICSSRKGTLPPNLQGIWNFYENTPWSGGYWHNINEQMNYWPVFSTNLSELFECYADYFKAYLPLAEKLTSESIARNHPNQFDASGRPGANGWSVGTGCHAYNVREAYPEGNDGNATGALMAEAFWDCYAFTQDETILRDTVAPAVFGSANFMSRVLEPHEGRWLAYPSASPENRVRFHPRGTAWGQQLALSGFRHAEALAAHLKTDDAAPLMARIAERRDRLDPVLIGTSGQIKEFREESRYGQFGDYAHRHNSQLIGLYPCSVISSQTPAWADAARTTLAFRSSRPSVWVGWPLAHRMALCARIGDGNAAYGYFRRLLCKGTYDNLWSRCPPFQIDANLGAVAGFAELLLQSHAGALEPLPALPDCRPDGFVRGLLGRGAFETDIAWRGGRLTRMTVRSRRGRRCRVRYPGIVGATLTDAGGHSLPTVAEAQDTLAFDTVPGGVYTLSAIPPAPTLPRPENPKLSADRTTLTWTAPASDAPLVYTVGEAVGNAPDYTPIADGLTRPSLRLKTPPTDTPTRYRISVRTPQRIGPPAVLFVPPAKDAARPQTGKNAR